MALVKAGFVKMPDGSEALNPKTLNAWLIAHDGYHCDKGDCDNLVLSSVDTLTQGYFRSIGEWGGPCCGGPSAKPPLATMQHALGQDPASMAFVAHVRNGSHFVLLTSWDTTRGAFAAQDPYYPTAFYRYDEISDVLLYEILPPEGAEVPRPYPVYKQFDYRWGSNTMIYGNTTIAEVGCLMSSTSMALHAHGVQIPTTSRGVVPSDPGSLNEWLKAHHGYVGHNNMEESSIPALSPARVQWSDKTGMHTTSDIPWPEIQERLRRGEPVIANVLKGRHFVLVVGWDKESPSTLYVNDPGFYRITYTWGDVVGWRLFNMTG